MRLFSSFFKGRQFHVVLVSTVIELDHKYACRVREQVFHSHCTCESIKTKAMAKNSGYAIARTFKTTSTKVNRKRNNREKERYENDEKCPLVSHVYIVFHFVAIY